MPTLSDASRSACACPECFRRIHVHRLHEPARLVHTDGQERQIDRAKPLSGSKPSLVGRVCARGRRLAHILCRRHGLRFLPRRPSRQARGALRSSRADAAWKRRNCALMRYSPRRGARLVADETLRTADHADASAALLRTKSDAVREYSKEPHAGNTRFLVQSVPIGRPLIPVESRQSAVASRPGGAECERRLSGPLSPRRPSLRFSVPAHRTGRDHFGHPALGRVSRHGMRSGGRESVSGDTTPSSPKTTGMGNRR